MDASILTALVVIVFMTLLLAGRRTLAAGTNRQVANGATLFVLATIAGLMAVAIMTSDTWY